MYRYTKDLKYEHSEPGKIELAKVGRHPDHNYIALELGIKFAEGTSTFVFLSMEDFAVILKDAKVNYSDQLVNKPIIATKENNSLANFRIMKEVL